VLKGTLQLDVKSCSASEYISSELKLRLVKALVIPQFLFGDVLFRMADSTDLHQT
jgi:hypothetical protein